MQENVESDWSEEVDRYGVGTVVSGYDDGPDESAAIGSQIPTLK